VRRAATLSTDAAGPVAAGVVDELVRAGRLVREEDRVRLPDHHPARPDPRFLAAMDRLEAALAVPAPPPLASAASAAGCSAAGIRELVRQGRIVVLEPGLAYAMSAYRDLAATALALSAAAPLTPAAFRDATGTSRKYVMPILEDLDRRGVLRRTPAGHLPGPRASAGAG
jgi:selenocysteine-specific elongation factor